MWFQHQGTILDGQIVDLLQGGNGAKGSDKDPLGNKVESAAIPQISERAKAALRQVRGR